ncbi:MAG: dehypoxanthine futalosine cyclase [Candidatus Omnitrophica bacterium]|nr:dehypoxanthine futalosine cyclase [Candidatus Omnitrophota bacterium]
MHSSEAILQKSLEGKRISPEEGVQLYRCDLLRLGLAADAKVNQLYPTGQVTFVVDRNIHYTNTCVIDCSFCAFHRHPADPQAYVLTVDEILEKVRELVEWGGTQVMLQGGVNPSLPMEYYLNVLEAIKKRFPAILIHSFSVVELDAMAKNWGVPLRETLHLFKQAGLNSLPGGGAEILVEEVRRKISPLKMSAERWLHVMREVHDCGLKSTATMVFGHVETVEDRVEHMVKLRELQDETGGFRAFIPWSLSPEGTPRMRHFHRAGGEDYLRTVAIARLMLDNIPHLQSGWLTEGLKLAQVALRFGCDDMGGTLFEDKVLEPTGIKVNTRREDLIRLIREAGKQPAQRDTNYEILWVDHEVEIA